VTDEHRDSTGAFIKIRHEKLMFMQI